MRARAGGAGAPGGVPHRAQRPLRAAADGEAEGEDDGGEEVPQPPVGRGVRVRRRRRRGGARRVRAQRGQVLQQRPPREGQGAPRRRHGDRRPLPRHRLVPAPAQEQEVQEEISRYRFTSSIPKLQICGLFICKSCRIFV